MTVLNIYHRGAEDTEKKGSFCLSGDTDKPKRTQPLRGNFGRRPELVLANRRLPIGQKMKASAFSVPPW